MFFKNIEFIKNIKKHCPLEKMRQLKLLILVFQNQGRKSLFRQKKTFIVNNYSDERFKYTLRMNRNTFNYILENIREGSPENYSNYLCN